MSDPKANYCKKRCKHQHILSSTWQMGKESSLGQWVNNHGSSWLTSTKRQVWTKEKTPLRAHVSGYRCNNCENLSIKYVQQSESAIKNQFLNGGNFKFTCFWTLRLCNDVTSYTKQDFLAISFFVHFFIDRQVIFRLFTLKSFLAKHDQHGVSFQSLPKINCMLITRLICIQWKFT